MASLSSEVLWSKVVPVLPPGTTVVSEPGEVRPMVVAIPGLGRYQIYVWTLTQDRSREGRPIGEFKIQLIVPGQGKGQRASLELDANPTALLGYSPDFGVLVGWEARLYTDFAYSTNVQVRDDLLVEARALGWGVAAPRTSQGAEEVRVAFRPAHLPAFLAASIEANARGLAGGLREAFFLSRVPLLTVDEPPADLGSLEEYISATRRRIVTERVIRSAAFAEAVKTEFDYGCAVCLTQINIVEAAHIVPVSEDGPDEVWNGVALCPNHHRLFDSRLFVVDPDLTLRVDQPSAQFLVDSRRDLGIETLQRHDGNSLLKPSFWDVNGNLRERMAGAFQLVVERAGMS